MRDEGRGRRNGTRCNNARTGLVVGGCVAFALSTNPPKRRRRDTLIPSWARSLTARWQVPPRTRPMAFSDQFTRAPKARHPDNANHSFAPTGSSTFPPEQHRENLSPTPHRSAEGATPYQPGLKIRAVARPPNRRPGERTPASPSGWRARAPQVRGGRLAQ